VEVDTKSGARLGIPDGTRGIVGWRPPMKHSDFDYALEWPVMFKLDVSAHDSFNMGIHTRAIRKDSLIVVELDGDKEIRTGALDWLARTGIELFCSTCGADLTRSTQGGHPCRADADLVERVRQEMRRQFSEA
jgi:hypothetical protein